MDDEFSTLNYQLTILQNGLNDIQNKIICWYRKKFKVIYVIYPGRYDKTKPFAQNTTKFINQTDAEKYVQDHCYIEYKGGYSLPLSIVPVPSEEISDQELLELEWQLEGRPIGMPEEQLTIVDL